MFFSFNRYRSDDDLLAIWIDSATFMGIGEEGEERGGGGREGGEVRGGGGREGGEVRGGGGREGGEVRFP